MKKRKHDNSTLEGCAERVSAKSELINIVKQYSKVIDKIESSQQPKFTTRAHEESPPWRKLLKMFKIQTNKKQKL